MKKTTTIALFLILPGMAAFLFFNLWPIVYSIYLAFTNAQLGNFPVQAPQAPKLTFVGGLENFRWILSDSKFRSAFLWTWVFVVTSVTLKVLAGIFLSLLYNSRYVKGKMIYRSLLIIPWALPLLFSVTVWRFMFDPIFGPVNHVLKSLGVHTLPNWINDPTWAFVALNIIEVWLAYPPFMITVITAALQSVPDTLVEAAIIDGANYWQRIRHVVLPIVGKPIAFATILTSAASFQYFMVPYIYNAGLFEDKFILLYGFRKAFGATPHYGRAAAVMIIATLVLAVYMYVNVKITRLQEGAKG